LGAPLHANMYEQIESPLFQHIYNFHSPADRVQTLDLTTPGSFSQTVFVAPNNDTLPDTLTQIELVITRNRTTKKESPTINNQRHDFEKPSILSGSSDLLRRSSPGHTELWFFEWVDSNYRKNFPLTPLPTIAIIPLILNATQHGVSPDEKSFIVDIRPEQEVFIIKTKNGHSIENLLSRKQHDELKSMANAYKPSNRSPEDYEEHGHAAVIKAKQEQQLSKQSTDL